MSHWVKYEAGSAVQMANKLVTGLKAAGRKDLVLLSQGAEETAPDNISPGRKVVVSFDTGYQKDVGGTPAQREVMANFLNACLGYGVANPSNTFTFFQNGRTGLYNAFLWAATPHLKAGLRPGVAVGDLSWPMVEDLAGDAFYAQNFHYKLRRGGFGEELERTIEHHKLDNGHRDSTVLAAVYSNYPNNPTGLYGTTAEIARAYDVLDRINTWRRGVNMPLITNIADNPYFAGLPGKDSGAFLQSPYEGVVKANGPTPTILVTSFAKALGFATPGVHAMTFSDDAMAGEFEIWAKSKAGFSYFPEAMGHVTDMLQSWKYPALREHFGAMAAKYARNHAILAAALPGMLLDGDPGMVCTMEIPADALGKTVIGHDGERHEIRTGRDVAEYAANMHGVIAVDQSVMVGGAERPLIRFALKTEDEAAMCRGAEGYALAIQELRAA
jgi:aspartate/methionine/tyrosine aminotransferase